MSVSSSFRTPLVSKRVHGSQTPVEPALQCFYPNFPLIQQKVISKISPLVRYQILGLFGNTFTGHRIYSRQKQEKLHEQPQTLLCQKRRTFSAIFIAFFECRQSLPHLGKRDQLYNLNISEVLDLDKCDYFNARKLLFQNTLRQ